MQLSRCVTPVRLRSAPRMLRTSDAIHGSFVLPWSVLPRLQHAWLRHMRCHLPSPLLQQAPAGPPTPSSSVLLAEHVVMSRQTPAHVVSCNAPGSWRRCAHGRTRTRWRITCLAVKHPVYLTALCPFYNRRSCWRCALGRTRRSDNSFASRAHLDTVDVSAEISLYLLDLASTTGAAGGAVRPGG